MQFYNPVSGAMTGYEVDLVTLIAGAVWLATKGVACATWLSVA